MKKIAALGVLVAAGVGAYMYLSGSKQTPVKNSSKPKHAETTKSSPTPGKSEQKGSSAKLKVIKDAEEFKSITAVAEKSCIIWGASWCASCKKLEEVLPAIMEKHPDLRFCKMDSEIDEELALGEDIMALPTVSLYQNGVQYAAKAESRQQQVEDFLAQKK